MHSRAHNSLSIVLGRHANSLRHMLVSTYYTTMEEEPPRNKCNSIWKCGKHVIKDR